jgi:hypothetical protein
LKSPAKGYCTYSGDRRNSIKDLLYKVAVLYRTVVSSLDSPAKGYCLTGALLGYVVPHVADLNSVSTPHHSSMERHSGDIGCCKILDTSAANTITTCSEPASV